MTDETHVDKHENYQNIHTDGQLMGALKPDTADTRTVRLMEFADTSKSAPLTFDWEMKGGQGTVLRYKKPFEPFRGQQFGSCTISSQAEYLRRVERSVKFGKDLYISDDIVNQRYFRLSGGQDTGLYETDALNDLVTTGFVFDTWNYKITGYASVGDAGQNKVTDLDALRFAIANFNGAKLCIDVPQNLYHSAPDDQIDYDPASPIVGGHSMYWDAYDTSGFWVVHTWTRKRQYVTNAFVTNLATEAHSLIDAKDVRMAKLIDMKKFKAAVREAQNTDKPQ
jgi:hypothetical protein